jgi:hypothetical protein
VSSPAPDLEWNGMLQGIAPRQPYVSLNGETGIFAWELHANYLAHPPHLNQLQNTSTTALLTEYARRFVT